MLFLDGFNSVYPMEKLHSFSPTELALLLCGDQTPEWSKDDILNYTDPKLGYTRERYGAIFIIYYTQLHRS
jgi:E3 ubiquitin-protein ligase HECTD1